MSGAADVEEFGQDGQAVGMQPSKTRDLLPGTDIASAARGRGNGHCERGTGAQRQTTLGRGDGRREHGECKFLVQRGGLGIRRAG
ncbi:hypothetical protein C8T65DRAFT_683560, partial [Cerioporus squamosus]